MLIIINKEDIINVSDKYEIGISNIPQDKILK